MRRRTLAMATAVAGIAAGVLPALAADQTVHASNFAFNAATVTVAVGETVTFVNDGGTHNVAFEDGQKPVATPSAAWPPDVKRTFTAAGTYRYECEAHGSAFTSGMVGEVVVVDASPSPTPSPTATATASPGPTATPTPSPGPNATAPEAPVRIVSARVSARRHGFALRIRLSRTGNVTATLRRHGRTVRHRTFPAYSVARTLHFAALRAGVYTLRLRTAGTDRTLRARAR